MATYCPACANLHEKALAKLTLNEDESLGGAIGKGGAN